MLKLFWGDYKLQEEYIKSLQMIKDLNIKSELEYSRLLRQFILLNLKSLKYMAGTKSFKNIVKLANAQN